MFQLSRTKKMFLIMIITTLIIPPIALIAVTSVFDSPFGDKFDHRLEQRLKENFKRGDLTQKQIEEIKGHLINKSQSNSTSTTTVDNFWNFSCMVGNRN